MRKVLFVHDGPMYTDQYGNVYGIHYNDKIVDRYTHFGENVTFLMREQQLENATSSSLSRITRDHFSFVSVPNFKSIRTYFLNKTKAKRIIEKSVSESDILVVRMPSATGVLAINAAMRQNKPFLVEMVACTFDAYWNYNWKGKLIAHYKKWKIQGIISNCPNVLYVTDRFLQNRYPTKGININISDVELRPLNHNDILNRIDRIKKSDLKKPLVLGTVAAIDVPYKGQDDVIKAIGKLKKQGCQVHYFIVGQGNPARLQSIIKEEALEEEVKILGAIKHEDVFDFLKEIDLYIQPSKQEGLPRALIEAMSSGLPALGARTAGIPELISSECIFSPGRINEICEKIMLVDNNWLLKHAKTNYEKSKEFTVPILEARRNLFYTEFLASIEK